MARHVIRINEMNGFEVDDTDGRLYWNGKGVVIEQRIGLDGSLLPLLPR